MLLCGEENLREVVLCPMNEPRRRPDDGRAVERLAEAIARAAHLGGEAQLKRHCGAWRGFAILGRGRLSLFLLPSVTTGPAEPPMK